MLEAGQEPVGSWPARCRNPHEPSCHRHQRGAHNGLVAGFEDGGWVAREAVIAAMGSFRNPCLPQTLGRDGFGGRVLHVVDYRSREVFAGQRVLVIRAGISAIQDAYELTEAANVSLVVRDRIRFAPQVIAGRDLHWWLTRTRVVLLPPAVLYRIVTGTRFRGEVPAVVLLEHAALGCCAVTGWRWRRATAQWWWWCTGSGWGVYGRRGGRCRSR